MMNQCFEVSRHLVISATALLRIEAATEDEALTLAAMYLPTKSWTVSLGARDGGLLKEAALTFAGDHVAACGAIIVTALGTPPEQNEQSAGWRGPLTDTHPRDRPFKPVYTGPTAQPVELERFK